MPQVPWNEGVTPPSAPYNYPERSRQEATDKQLAQAAYNAGFRGDNLVKAVAIGLAESHGNVYALNNKSEFSVGVWQINLEGYLGKRLKRFGLGSWTDLYSLQNNANAAYNVSRGSHFNMWSTYKHGTYLNYVDRANVAAQAITGQQPVVIGASNTTDNTMAAKLVAWIQKSYLNDMGLGITFNKSWQNVVDDIRNGSSPLIGESKPPDPALADYLTQELSRQGIPLDASISQDGLNGFLKSLALHNGVNDPTDLLGGIATDMFAWVQPLLAPVAHAFYWLVFIIIAIALLIVGVMAAGKKE